jgi:nucleotide-binding universal stress UspA family protein
MERYETTYGYRGSRWMKRIVVAADGSAASTRGLEEVADLAPRVGANVVVVFVRACAGDSHDRPRRGRRGGGAIAGRAGG